jgi:L-amino acid N-acyltransferase YncA
MAEEVWKPFHVKNGGHRKPPNGWNKSKPAASQDDTLARLREPMDEDKRNKLIQGIDNLTWSETFEFTKQYDKERRQNRPVQQPIIGMENESHSCPELLPKARDGPGVDPCSSVYKSLEKPRFASGTEEPERWAVSDPPDFIPDGEYKEESDLRPKWSRINIDTAKFRAQWDESHDCQAKAYGESHHIFPVVKDGRLTFTSEFHKAIYEPEQPPLDDWTMDKEAQDELWRRHEHKIASFDISNLEARKQFRSWWDQLPTTYHVVNIHHVAFFDGTAMPDGERSMFLPGIKHIPTPRDMKDELTRLHWHETSEGYVYNLGKVNQQQRKKEREREEHLRRTAPYRAWENLPPGSKVVPPNIYLRPAESYDASCILEIMNWYAMNSATSSDVTPMHERDFESLLQSCREEKFPFVVAARRPPERWYRNQIDPAVGYAYVGFHRDSKSADAHMGELRVFVEEDSKKKHIGRALVDMVFSCFEDRPKENTDYEFDQTGTVQYGPGYGRPLNTMVCTIASSPRTQEDDIWIKKWLERDFGFQEKGMFEGARVKNGNG